MKMTKRLIAVALMIAPIASFAVTKESAVKAYSNHVYNSYNESYQRALSLKSAIDNFVAAPSLITQEVAKNAWKHARESYGQTEVFRFYNGPIDRDGGPEGELNAWPLDENYIDYVVGAPNSGIINDTLNFPAITQELLISLNELDGEKNISTGYHAIEFLLWGQDLFADGAGRRSFEDYLLGVTPNAHRRGQYLQIVTELLVGDLEDLKNAWQPARANNFRVDFEKQVVSESVKNILTGMIFLAGDELSGERMYVAYDTMGQEDEHSCFSDMTHMDIQWNYWGIENILRVTRLLELPEVASTKEVASIKASLVRTHALLASIPVPFDQAIIDEQGRKIILSSVESLEQLAIELAELSKLLGSRVDY